MTIYLREKCCIGSSPRLNKNEYIIYGLSTSTLYI